MRATTEPTGGMVKRLNEIMIESTPVKKLDADFVQDYLLERGILKAELKGMWDRALENQHRQQHKEFPQFDKSIKTFKLVVPKDYNHQKPLSKFQKEHGKEFWYYSNAITDQNFTKVTNKLIPGKEYEVSIYPIKEGKVVSSEDCLKFLKSKTGNILVGVQGLSLTYQLHKDKFPKGKWSLSLDEKDALWEDSDGYHMVPSVTLSSGGDWGFRLSLFEVDWNDGIYLVCFCDLENLDT